MDLVHFCPGIAWPLWARMLAERNTTDEKRSCTLARVLRYVDRHAFSGSREDSILAGGGLWTISMRPIHESETLPLLTVNLTSDAATQRQGRMHFTFCVPSTSDCLHLGSRTAMIGLLSPYSYLRVLVENTNESPLASPQRVGSSSR